VLRGTETLLLVEDDDGLRMVGVRVLGHAGYRVLAARDRTSARDHVRAEGKIDLLVTDVVLPDGSGPELAAELTAAQPSLRVLFTSGFTAKVMKREGVVAADATFLEKPYGADALRAKVREALDRRS
jgi:two-component system, cell cycle sensor histidine kinase and response regulator CckA